MKLRDLAFSLREMVDRVARQRPMRLAILAFAGIITVFTILLYMPWATATGIRARFVDALFTAVSAVCVTGLTVVPTGEYWSTAGLVTIMFGIKVGGLGIMTLASILGLTVSRRIGLTQRLLTASEFKSSQLGEVGSLIRVVIITSTTLELVIAAMLFPRFLSEGASIGTAAWHGIFYGVSSFNNAGFVPTPEGLAPYVGDWLIAMPIAVGVFVGSLGFPVILNVGRHLRKPRLWSLHAKLTVATSAALFLGAALLLGALEWNNPNTMGAYPVSTRILMSIFSAVMPRSGGLSIVDVSEMTQASWMAQDALMFIGGGSASTGGGIKVTTFAVMLLAIVAEARGDPDVEAFGRRIPPSTLRLAVAVTLVGCIVILIAGAALLEITKDQPWGNLSHIIFEALSAFGTVGLSTGITPLLPDAGKYVIIALMFIGRTGTMTVAAALAIRERRRVIRYPEERPIIG